VQAVIDWFGPDDFRSLDAELRASGRASRCTTCRILPNRGFWGIRLPDASADLLRRTNPVTYLGPGLPPFLVQHGSDDDLVPVEQSMLLARARRGVLPETDVRLDVILGSRMIAPLSRQKRTWRACSPFCRRP